jgi:FKBP-type peptidyl-prolyl cis-trans isomerase
MSKKLSVEEVLVHLETQMAHHKQQQEHHAERETFHRERKEAHAAEHEAIARHYETFKAAAESAVELAARTGARRPAVQELPPGQRVRRSDLVARVVSELPSGEVFDASHLTEEVNRRYQEALRKPADVRLVSTTLRRMAARGAIRLAESGKPHHEARYTKA